MKVSDQNIMVVLDDLKARGLIDRLRTLRVGNVSLSLNAPAGVEYSDTERPPANEKAQKELEDIEREQLLFGSSG